ncbi:MAG: hypothetical protein NT075_10700 [Chloroflexi bacterium]|nr:hypothetical protein [Chloroflexota bacterium]
MAIKIRKAIEADAPQMAALSEQRRIQYQVYQPVFWRKAKDSEQVQRPFLAQQIANDEIIALVCEGEGGLRGFVIATVWGGKVCNIDDFCVALPAEWAIVGRALLEAAGEAAKAHGIERYLIVCGHLDHPKRAMLQAFGLSIDHYWFTAPIVQPPDQNSPCSIRPAQSGDVAQMAVLAKNGRTEYAEIGRDNALVLVCEKAEVLLGYAIGRIVSAPPVYDPGGQTCLVSEFVVGDSTDWPAVGTALFEEIVRKALRLGGVQIVAVCDAADQPKQAMLQASGLTIASEWYQ